MDADYNRLEQYTMKIRIHLCKHHSDCIVCAYNEDCIPGLHLVIVVEDTSNNALSIYYNIIMILIVVEQISNAGIRINTLY